MVTLKEHALFVNLRRPVKQWRWKTMPKRDFSITKPVNEKALSYAPGTKERSELKRTLSDLRDKVLEIPLVIGGKPVKTGSLGECRCPHEHTHLLARYHNAGESDVNAAIESALSAREPWSSMELADRAAVSPKPPSCRLGPIGG